MTDFSAYPVKRIVVEIIPSAEQRYPTIGDYWLDADGTLQFRSSKMPDYREAYACILHELAEAFLCLQQGVPFGAIDDFDRAWESARVASDQDNKVLGDGTEIDEPGDDPSAPYFEQHKTGDIIERQYANAAGLHWQKYEQDVATEYEREGWN